jgi:hypothetical protein
VRRVVRFIVLLFSLFLLTEGCRAAPDRTPDAGHLEVEWTGSVRSRISGPATAQWCGLRRLLEIQTVQGDTGIALALYPAETLAVGTYRVVDPIKAESIPPAAGIALRWLAQNAVQGFRGDSGTVELERSTGGLLSGTVKARARSVVDTQRVAITGTFRGLTARPESLGCVESLQDTEMGEDAEPGDTGVH